jgi:hypothetical protein
MSNVTQFCKREKMARVSMKAYSASIRYKEDGAGSTIRRLVESKVK